MTRIASSVSDTIVHGLLNSLFILIFLLSITACSNSDNLPPTNNENLSVNEKLANTGEPVDLSVSDVSDEPAINSETGLNIQWELVSKPEGSTAVISDANTANPTFIPDLAGEYVLHLTVTNNGDVLVEETLTVIADSSGATEQEPTPNPNPETQPDEPPPEPATPQKPDSHLLTSNNCLSCHDETTWGVTVVDHEEVIGECVSCHNGTDASGKSPNHINSTDNCSACHNTSWWAPATNVSHTEVNGTCASCHVNTIIERPPHPIPTTDDCGACHGTSAWSPVTTVDHDAVVGECSSCHNGSTATGMPENHIATTNPCDTCHSTSQWATANGVDHAQFTGPCVSCHNNVAATGKTSTHIPSTDLCDACHTTSAWTPVDIVDHSEVVGTCVSCHDGTLASGKSSNHIATTDQCGACHSEMSAWVPATAVDHSQVIGECIDCHNNTIALGKSPDHIPSSDDCASCHTAPDESWLITRGACSTDPVQAGPLEQSIQLTSSVFPDLEIIFSTKAFSYDLSVPCVPVYLQLTNTGSAAIELSEEQALSLSNVAVGLYDSGSRLFSQRLAPESSNDITPGLFLPPGESTYFSAIILKERLALYTIPPLGGGIVESAANIQGPFGDVSLFDMHRFDITYTVDFDTLPTSRVSEPGAGTDFVAGEVIVGFEDNVSLEQAESIAADLDSHIDNTSIVNNRVTFNIVIPFNMTTSRMMTILSTIPEVRYSQRNFIVSIPPGEGGVGAGI